MKLIAHRGNINGPNINENKPEYILETIRLGYDCEIDVRYLNGKLFLGHDNADYEINISFLTHNSTYLWIHCKNIEALNYLLYFKELNIFWHQEDNYTLTSKQIIWSYPKMTITNKCIILMPENNNFEIDLNAYGVCTDYVIKCCEKYNLVQEIS